MNWRSALFLDVFAELRSLIPRAYHRKAVALFGSMTLSSLLEVLGLGLLIPLMSFVFSRQVTSGDLLSHLTPVGWANGMHATALVTLVCILIFFVKNAYLAVHAWFEASFAFSVHSSLSEKLTRRFLILDYTRISKRTPAELASIVTADVSSVVFHCLLPTLTVISELLFTGAIIIFLFYVEPVIASGVVASVAVASLAFVLLTRGYMVNLGIRRQRQEALKGAQLQQVFQGAREILIYGAGEFFQGRFRNSFQDLSRSYRDFQLISTLPRFFLEFLAVATLIAIIGISVQTGHTAQEVLTRIALFTASGFRLLVGANRLIMSAQSIRFGQSSLMRVAEELAGPDMPIKKASACHGSDPLHSINSLSISAVGFVYPGSDRRLLTDVSLTLNVDSMVGIVGKSGIGKSTLLDLIAGLQRPTSGMIAADGIDIGHNMEAWRSSIGYVSQVPIIFSDTLKRNIAFGIPDQEIDESRIHAAARDAQLDELIVFLPQGLNTKIGEGGEGLSGGQRQRIAIARALYRLPDVLLLDEPTSSLDPDAERSLMEMLVRLRSRRIVLIATHRPTPLEFCDLVFRIADGIACPIPVSGQAEI